MLDLHTSIEPPLNPFKGWISKKPYLMNLNEAQETSEEFQLSDSSIFAWRW